jgi:hypothetical protein
LLRFVMGIKHGDVSTEQRNGKNDQCKREEFPNEPRPENSHDYVLESSHN